MIGKDLFWKDKKAANRSEGVKGCGDGTLHDGKTLLPRVLRGRAVCFGYP